MGTAYTPGLTVSGDTIIRKERRLPLKGDVLVQPGDQVTPDQVVARTELPGTVSLVRASERLGVEADEMVELLRKEEGERVEHGELLAETKGLLGRFFKTQLVAPATGTIERINPRTGSLEIRHPPIPVEVRAYIQGEVVETMEGDGAVIETRGSLIQGIFGVGGETRGTLHLLTASAEKEADAGAIGEQHQGGILVTGGQATFELLDRAREVGAAGVVCGCLLDPDLRQLLGYDLGVAITGEEQVGLTLVVTEGFGSIRMAGRTFDLLQQLAGQQASASGATQIRAGVIRPEVIVSRQDLQGKAPPESASHSQMLDLGTPIRLIREPYFGRLGRVSGLPAELQRIETGAEVRVLVAALEDGQEVTVPRADVEIVIE